MESSQNGTESLRKNFGSRLRVVLKEKASVGSERRLSMIGTQKLMESQIDSKLSRRHTSKIRGSKLGLLLMVIVVCIVKTSRAAIFWQDGWYLENQVCVPWDSSCRQWDTTDAWLTCEPYMYLDDNTNKCTFWPDGEYYDGTMNVCRDWEGSCDGYCQYQTSCFECTNDKILDINMMSWVDVWETPKIYAEGKTLNVAKLWRDPEFYVDSESESTLELGTLEHPYRSINPVFVEILNHHSHKDININIYLKEGTVTNMEIDSGYILNITSVSISTYTNKSSMTERAILIPTTATQSTVSSKASFYLHNSYTLSLTEALDNSGFSENEKVQLMATKRYIKVVRSGITLSNVNVMHTDFSRNSGSILIDLMYLQDKTLTITNCNFNVSGIIAQSVDPLGINLENIFIDIWALDIAFDFFTSCGYPGANLTSGLVMKNITTDCSIFTTEIQRPRIIFYSGPGNIFVDTMSLPNSYSNILSFSGAFYLSVESVCQLTDAEPRIVEIKNVYMSIPENPYGLFYNMMGIRFDKDFYRTNVISLSKFTVEGFDKPPMSNILLASAMNAEVTYSDSVHRDYSPNYPQIQIYWTKSVTLRNLIFENYYDTIEATIDLGAYETATLDHVTFRNYTVAPDTFF